MNESGSGHQRNGPDLIVASDLSLAYGSAAPVLRGLDFAIPAGSLVAVLGPNGGGKTTLLRAIAGELPVAHGYLARNSQIAYLGQTDRTRLDLPLSAKDVVEMGLLGNTPWWRPPNRRERAQADEALALVGLAESTETTFGDLSGGQRRRVLLARTIIQGAPVLLLDEPFAGVDPASAQTIAASLEALRDDGRSLLIATHDIEQARSSDLVLCLNKRQVAFGVPAQVLSVEVLRETYGSDLKPLDPDGAFAIQTHHH